LAGEGYSKKEGATPPLKNFSLSPNIVTFGRHFTLRFGDGDQEGEGNLKN
jgi:hypothetical protein